MTRWFACIVNLTEKMKEHNWQLLIGLTHIKQNTNSNFHGFFHACENCDEKGRRHTHHVYPWDWHLCRLLGSAFAPKHPRCFVEVATFTTNRLNKQVLSGVHTLFNSVLLLFWDDLRKHCSLVSIVYIYFSPGSHFHC